MQNAPHILHWRFRYCHQYARQRMNDAACNGSTTVSVLQPRYMSRTVYSHTPTRLPLLLGHLNKSPPPQAITLRCNAYHPPNMPIRTDKEVHNQRLIVGLTTALLVLCYVLYFLRILSRKVLKTPLWIDDWFMLFALVRFHCQLNRARD